ncbi:MULTISPECIES: AsmA family protein [Actibacterium]|uniref:AsmA protein n=1 Tax=Actibacterium naphthalenivorans TaxID=1614693 RepID=A0A840CEH9_9RHOB|nr:MULTISPECIES: AsmA family protein [Actibacterium]ALG91741.1 hypothetical protein TQ29_02315 [Actibacterium sp. EMB200-NS6]MBB4021196.1 AsmA protein [Actibacterium naphthalenivorans]
MRWLFRIILSLVLLVVVLVAAVFLLPAERIGALAGDQLRAATGREVTLGGRLRPSLYPNIGVSTGPVTVSNADWASGAPLLQAEGLSVGLDLGALLRGDVEIKELGIRAPRITLERAADGRANWVFDTQANATAAGPDGTQGAQAGRRALTIGQATITDGALSFIDHGTGRTQSAEAVEATLSLPAVQGPATLSLEARVNGQPVSLNATAAAAAPFLAGDDTALTAELRAGGARIAFDGHGGQAPLAASGTLDADLADLPALFRAAGQPAPELPAGVGKILRLTGQVTYAPEGSLHLRQVALTQDSNRITGEADLFLDGKPRLNGQFTAGALDLGAFLTAGPAGRGGKSGGGGGARAGGWSTDPIDVSALSALDAELALAADSIDLGRVRLGHSRLLATLNDRRLTVDLREVRAYDGLVTGNLVLNGRGGVSVGGDLTLAGMAMQPLLGEVADFRRLRTSADMQLTFLGSGASPAAIMQSLSGSGALAFGQGAFLGLDLAQILRSRTVPGAGAGADARTIFDSITGQFSIKDGVLGNSDLTLLAPLLTASGKGVVNLGAQTLDYRIVPVALPGADGAGGLSLPLHIRGPWSGPRLSIDLAAIAEGEKEERLKELREDIGKELGVDPATDGSLEDALKKKLGDEAARGLRNLLKGD